MPRESNEFAYFNDLVKEQMTYAEFLHKIQDPNRVHNYYFAEQNVPEALAGDIQQPWLGTNLLVFQEYAIWHGFGTVSLPHTDNNENFMCVLKGWKDFTIVSPF